MLCHACNTDNRPERKFCAKCGQSLLSPCSECGFKNQPDESFCGGCGKDLGEKNESTSPPRDSALESGSGSAERRQLTVLFCDLADSTRMSVRMDPEDLNRLNRDYQDICSGVIKQFSGFVARYMGDGILSYFGYPVAHENDAENAILAALELLRQIDKLKPEDYQGERLSIRIGIATGAVVVGDVVGEGASRESTAVGQTPNLAARLQGLARPGEVVIADQTHELAGALFEYKDLGSVDIKGMESPVRLWQVTTQKSTGSRFDALSGSTLTPMVGRHHEISLARECWAEAANENGQVIMLSGEPGIGKSRLVQMISQLSADESPRILQCSPHHQSSALYPVRECLNHYLSQNHGQSSSGLQQMLIRRGVQEEGAEELLSDFLFIDEAKAQSAQATAQQRKQKLLQLLQGLLTGSKSAGPVMLVIEDLHWLDPTSQELLNALIPYIVDKPVLLVVTYRPEYVPDWIGQAHVHLLSLNRINSTQCYEMIKSIAGDQFTRMLAEQIIKRTDGIPLFVEEMTRTVLGSHLDSNGSVLSIDVPATLADSLNARLDRLGPARRVAQAGSVIGREFDHEMLKAVSGQSDADLDTHLESMLQSGLVFQFGSGSDLYFQFKHALIQNAAYASLLRDQQKQYHQRVAEFLEQNRPEMARSQAYLLARHFKQAGFPEKSLHYWCRAGRQALSASATSEALSHYLDALEIINTAQFVGPDELELEVHLGLASCYRFNDRYQDALGSLQQAEALAQKLDRVGQLSDICNIRGNIYFTMGSHENCLVEHRHSLEYAGQQGSLENEIRAMGGLGDAHYSGGEMKAAMEQFSRCCDLAQANGYVFQDAANRAMIGWSRVYELEFAEALQDARQAIEICKQCGHHRGRLNAEALACFASVEMGDFEVADRHNDHAHEMADKLGSKNFGGLLIFSRVDPRDLTDTIGNKKSGLCRRLLSRVGTG